MISISTITVQTVGNLVFRETVKKTKLRDLKARVSRTGTLDGECVITHSGITDADRTLDIRANLTEDQADDLQTIFEAELFVMLSCGRGLFYGSIDSGCNISNGQLKMKFLVQEKMNA